VREKKKLGRMLVESGLMTEFQLNQAVLNQKKSRLRLGQYLIREGVVSESQIVI
jgi:type IV pilus assembly protein PilB